MSTLTPTPEADTALATDSGHPKHRVGSRFWTRAALITGTVVTLLGVVGVVAWPLHRTSLLQYRVNYTPIAFNTALATALSGVAIVVAASLLRSRLAWFVRVVGVFDVVLGVAAALENWGGWDLHIDQLLMHAYFTLPGRPPGRPAANTAICFVVVGIALVSWRPHARGWRAKVLPLASVIVSGIAVIALFDFMLGPAPATGRSGVSMALPTALAVCVLAAGLLALGLSDRDESSGPVNVWIAVPIGIAAFAVAGILWQSLINTDGTNQVSASSASRAALLLALLVGVTFALTSRLAQRSNHRRHEAVRAAETLRREVRLRSEAEAAARENETLLFKFLDALPVGVLILRQDGQPYFFNQAGRQLLPRAAVPPTSAENLAEVYGLYLAGTDEPYPMDRSPIYRGLAGESTHVDDVQIRRPDRTVLLDAWGTPLRNDSGEVLYSMVAFVDITERHRAEIDLAQKATLLDLSGDAIFIRDRDGRIKYWNQGAATMYGWSAEEARGQSSIQLLKTQLPEPLDVVEDQLRSAGRWQGQVVNIARSGEPLTVVSQWVAEFDEAGSIASVMETNTDITALKAAQQELEARAAELEKLNVEYERSNNDLEQFAYAASHDLAEPLRAISGPISLLARRYRGQLDDDADTFIDFAVEGCERMQTLINDLLAFSRAGRVNADVEAVDANRIVENVLADLGTTIEQRGAIVSAGELPTVRTSPAELRQLLQNLISNALKFAPADVTPKVSIAAERAGAFWRFTVTDNGIGIEPRHRERIFGMFKRLHSREDYPGTGIGLALAKKIVEHHGGEIGVADGSDGVGSTFWFTLPVEEAIST